MYVCCMSELKWFQNWFNSPYYHILYNKRDDEEAELFIDNLCALLMPGTQDKILDIACGRGRHAIYLNKKGYDVVGIDLSEESIKHASVYENTHLHFLKHDMRNLFYINYFDIALNLFTSFGYFDTDRDNQNAMHSFASSLKTGGYLVLDFMNTQKVIDQLVIREKKTCNKIEFDIHRKVEGNAIIKEISFEDRDKKYAYKEQVQALKRVDFERYFQAEKLEVIHVFGNYELQPYDEHRSDRMIFICRKTA